MRESILLAPRVRKKIGNDVVQATGFAGHNLQELSVLVV